MKVGWAVPVLLGLEPDSLAELLRDRLEPHRRVERLYDQGRITVRPGPVPGHEQQVKGVDRVACHRGQEPDRPGQPVPLPV